MIIHALVLMQALTAQAAPVRYSLPSITIGGAPGPAVVPNASLPSAAMFVAPRIAVTAGSPLALDAEAQRLASPARWNDASGAAAARQEDEPASPALAGRQVADIATEVDTLIQEAGDVSSLPESRARHSADEVFRAAIGEGASKRTGDAGSVSVQSMGRLSGQKAATLRPAVGEADASRRGDGGAIVPSPVRPSEIDWSEHAAGEKEASMAMISFGSILSGLLLFLNYANPLVLGGALAGALYGAFVAAALRRQELSGTSSKVMFAGSVVQFAAQGAAAGLAFSFVPLIGIFAAAGPLIGAAFALGQAARRSTGYESHYRSLSNAVWISWGFAAYSALVGFITQMLITGNGAVDLGLGLGRDVSGYDVAAVLLSISIPVAIVFGALLIGNKSGSRPAPHHSFAPEPGHSVEPESSGGHPIAGALLATMAVGPMGLIPGYIIGKSIGRR